MSKLREEALELVDLLYSGNRLSTYEYNRIYDALDDIEPLRDRDGALEELWGRFEDIPMNPKTECIEEEFLGWAAGTSRDEIWRWFDTRYSKGIGYLLYNDGIDRTEGIAKMVYLKQLCIECESQTCQFNYGGECRFAMVHERAPRISDYDGCIDFDYQEGEC